MLTLGGITFEDWELPESIRVGGAQRLVVHRMIGGKRVLDAMGPDDAPISWSGHLMGETASLRALQLDLLRRDGKPRELAFDLRIYRVVISNFQADLQLYPIPYTLTVEVEEDLVADRPAEEVRQLEDQIQADIEGAQAAAAAFKELADGINIAIEAVLLVKRYGPLRALGAYAMAGVRTAVQQGVEAATAEAVTQNTALAAASNPGLLPAGADAGTMAASFGNLTGAATGAFAAQHTASLLGRASANLAGITR